MIDFRYHLVSLVSVFLALAVGIVLGAGPLKESIGKGLTESVNSLRLQKDALHDELATANTGLDRRDTFVKDVTPSLVGGQLADRSVAVLSLPDVDNDTVDPLVNAVTTAGGKVTGRVSLNSSWTDPAKAEARAKAVSDLTAALPTGSVPAGDDVDAQLSGLLAGALVSPAASPATASTANSKTVLDTLRSADLIEVKGNVSGLAGGALVLAPAVDDSTPVKATPAPNALASYVTLAETLDTVGGGTVVTGPASSATDGGVLTSVRKDDATKDRVSTVDTGSTPMGVVTAVWALREQLAGNSGSYGFGSGVDDVMPTLPAVAGTSATTSPSATK
jgi:hypothetical protein